jgi:hypothetical protein
LNEKPLISRLNTSPFMKWVLTIGILAVVAITILGMGTVGLGTTHYCMPLATHGFTPMICRMPLPPGMPLKPLPIPHPNYH